jgi:carbonic anhydrase
MKRQTGGLPTDVAASSSAISAGSNVLTDRADAALQRLIAGNERFVKSIVTHRPLTIKETREELVQGQKPYAIILSCSDSRVPPEIVFDATLGQLFVVRVAGNVLDPLVLGSIEYAVENFGPALIMVLGHEACGAVTAAFDATGKAEGNVEAVIEPIIPGAKKARDAMGGRSRAEQVDAAIDNNIDIVARGLTVQSSIIGDYVERGKLKIVRGKYRLHHGEVTLLHPL